MLGALLAFGWPGTAMWALGVLLGVNLIFAGAMHSALALDCRRKQRQDADEAAATHAAHVH